MPLPVFIYRALGTASIAVLEFAKEQKRRLAIAQQAGKEEIEQIKATPQFRNLQFGMETAGEFAPVGGFVLARPGVSRFVSGLNKQEKDLLGELLKVEDRLVALGRSKELVAQQGAIRSQLAAMVRKQGIPGFRLTPTEVEAQIERMKAFFTHGVEFKK